MNIFGDYARYYDLIYQDKDYSGETAFIDCLIRDHVTNPQRVLELGCGTGIHAVLLAQQGYQVSGLDFSTDMLEAAARRVADQPGDVAERIRLSQGDARDFSVDGHFDAVIALFHVMSYQLRNDDLRAVLDRVKAHLAPEGVFIFDCWYGPAVLTDRPEVREKQFADSSYNLTRIAVPTMHANINCVDVDYKLLVRNADDGTVDEFAESHRVRYLFRPELELLADAAGLRIESWGAWMSEKQPDFSTWYVYFVLKHRA